MQRVISARRVHGAALLILAALAGLTACAKPPVATLYPQVAEYDGREIAELSFVNPEPFGTDSLRRLTETHETDCSFLFLPFCFPGTDWGLDVGRVDMNAVGRDLSRMETLYRRSGYFGTRVIPQIDEMDEEDGPVHFRFVVNRGDAVVMDSVVVEGTEGIADPDSLEALLPLQPGELFDLAKFLESADVVTEALRRGGHAYAEVLRNYGVDTIQDRATVWLLAIPGPRVVVDSVLVDGLEELGRRDVVRQLTFETGDLLRARDLRDSQRNLYDLNLIRFASVAVAPDSLQLTPADSSTATVRIALTEAPEHVVETRIGYGNLDCFGVRGQWTDRSVLGGGRQLTLTGSVSRIGLGEPLSGLQNTTLCSQGVERELADALDYRLAADFNQPYFLSPRNQLAATAFSERLSLPGLFQRTATGGRGTVSRRLTPREYITGGVEAEYRVTEAVPVLYCFGFQVCEQADIDEFRKGRWRNGLTASWVRDRGNTSVDPTAGYTLQSNVSWSTALLGSDFNFVRASAEGAIYRSIRGGWVLAGFARMGTFLTRVNLRGLSPEDRFYAGGASSVRGFGRIRMGPGIYLYEDTATVDPEPVVPHENLPVEFFPTGGASVSVLSVEGRFPSPVLRELLRLAVFVDAGTIGDDPIWDAESQWRVTPGAGLRLQTPVGPIRADVGYNPYPPVRAPLYATTPGSRDIVRITEGFRPAPPSPWSLQRFTLHIAVGQAF